MGSPFLSVVVPAYNEEARIGRTLQEMCAYLDRQAYTWQLTVVDDGSKDATRRLVEEVATREPRVALLAYSPNRGKGYAVRKGMLAATGERVLFMDADLATPPPETAVLMQRLDDGADIALGSRPLKESKLDVRQPFYREAFGRVSNLLVQSIGIRGIRDTQCGFKMFTQRAARDVFTRCKMNGFSFDMEALMIGRDLGLRLDEVPIRWADQAGSKVVLWRDAPKVLADLFRMRLMGKRRRLEPNREAA